MNEQREHFVYRLFDSSGELLYVGCTNNLERRWAEHRSTRAEFTRRAVRCAAQGPFTRKVARLIEKAAAQSEFPLYGWTPPKQAAIQRRLTWVRRRTLRLVEEGVDWRLAHDRATAEARRKLGPDITYRSPCPRIRLISSVLESEAS